MRHNAQLTNADKDNGQMSGALPETGDNGGVADTSNGFVNVIHTPVDRNTLASTSYKCIQPSRNKAYPQEPTGDQAKKLKRSNSGFPSRKSSSKTSMSSVDNTRVISAEGSEENVHDRQRDIPATLQQANQTEITWRTIIFMPEVSEARAYNESGYNVRWRTSVFMLQEK